MNSAKLENVRLSRPDTI